MRAVERLFLARCDFDNSWRAHSAALRSTTLVLAVSPEGSPLLTAALSMSKGFESGFDSVFALEHLLDEIGYLKDKDFFPLRKNCLLGVCASFENFAKTCAAALSYEPDWQSMAEGERLGQDTEGDFLEKYKTKDDAWRRDHEKFLSTEFPWLNGQYVQMVSEVFWLRNQLAHNADRARNDKQLTVCSTRFSKGAPIALGGDRLSACVGCLRESVRLISDQTPYLEAIQ